MSGFRSALAIPFGVGQPPPAFGFKTLPWFRGGTVETPAPSPTYQYLGSPIQYVTGNRVRYAWDDEEEKKKPKEVVKLGPVRQAQIETGIVHVKAKKHTPNTDRLNWLASENIATESKKRQRIRQMIARDDEWLMSI